MGLLNIEVKQLEAFSEMQNCEIKSLMCKLKYKTVIKLNFGTDKRQEGNSIAREDAGN